MFRWGLGLAFLGLIAACGESTSADSCVGMETITCSPPEGALPTGTSVVVGAEWLLERIDDAELQLVDARGAAFSRSRIPGAISITPSDVAGTIDGVAGQLIPAEEAEPILGALGLLNGATVVVYGDSPEYDPARIVWALRHYGQGDVRYLDGGFDAWVAAGGLVDEEPPAIEPSGYVVGEVRDVEPRLGASFMREPDHHLHRHAVEPVADVARFRAVGRSVQEVRRSMASSKVETMGRKESKPAISNTSRT